MQLGHVGVALAIASYDPRPTTFGVVFAAHFFPNADSLVIRAGLAQEDFHGTWSHTLLCAALVGLVAGVLFGPTLGWLALFSMLAHILADMPTDIGVPFLLPLSRRRFSFNLWATSGYWGASMFRGYYAQKWPRLLEGAVFLLVIALYLGRWLAAGGGGERP